MAKKSFQTCHFKFRYTKIRESILKYDFIKLNKYIYSMWFGGGGGGGSGDIFLLRTGYFRDKNLVLVDA